MIFVDKAGKPLAKGDRVRTLSTASPTWYADGTVFSIGTVTLSVLWDLGEIEDFLEWEAEQLLKLETLT